MSARGLGRGLDALIPREESAESGGTTLLPVEKIRTGKFQPRGKFSEESLAQLGESIREHGMVQPVVVRRAGDGYELVAGERRLRAARLAGLTEVPAVVREVSDEQAMEIALVENLQREDLNPMEQARGLRSLIDRFGLTQEACAARLGMSRSQVANILRLLALPGRVQELLEEGLLSAGHAKVLAGVADGALAERLAERAVAEQWSVRQLEEALGRGAGPVERPRHEGLGGWLEPAEKLKAALGTRVRITGAAEHGRIVLEFYGAEDLERLVGIILRGAGVGTSA